MLRIILCFFCLEMTFLLQAQQLDKTGDLKNFQISSIPMESLNMRKPFLYYDYMQPLANGTVLYARQDILGNLLVYVLDTNLKVVAKQKLKLADSLSTIVFKKTSIERLGDKFYWILQSKGKKKADYEINCLEIRPNGSVLSPQIVASGPKEDDEPRLEKKAVVLAPQENYILGNQLGHQVVGNRLVTYSASFDGIGYACDIRVYDADMKRLQQKKFYSKEKWCNFQFLLDANENLYMLSYSNYIEAARAKESSAGVEYNMKKSNNYAYLHLLRVDDTQFTNLPIDWKYLPRHFQVISKPLSNELILVGAYNNKPSWDAASKQWHYWKDYSKKKYDDWYDVWYEASGLFYLKLDLPSAKVVQLNYEPTSKKVSLFENPEATPDQIEKGLGTPINNIQCIEWQDYWVVASTFDEPEVSYLHLSRRNDEWSPTIKTNIYECYPIWVTVLDKSGKLVSQQVLPRLLHSAEKFYAGFKLLKYKDDVILIYLDHPKNRSDIPQTIKETKRGSATDIRLPVETRWTVLNFDGVNRQSSVFSDPKNYSYSMRTNSNYTWLVNGNQLWSVVLQPRIFGIKLHIVKIQM